MRKAASGNAAGKHRLSDRSRRTHILAMLPMAVFCLVFVLGPISYMFVLSFLTQSQRWGVEFRFTLKNYLDILEPVYLNTFLESLELALITTVIVSVIWPSFRPGAERPYCCSL